ncbi:hypothetical protein ACFL08_02270 [Patescibacteria group bacterium]
MKIVMMILSVILVSGFFSGSAHADLGDDNWGMEYSCQRIIKNTYALMQGAESRGDENLLRIIREIEKISTGRAHIAVGDLEDRDSEYAKTKSQIATKRTLEGYLETLRADANSRFDQDSLNRIEKIEKIIKENSCDRR